MPTTSTATSHAVFAGGPALARVERRIATRRQQTALVLVTLTVASAALATGHHQALAIVPACVVTAIALTASLAMLASDRHARVLELIADGHGGLPLPAVQRERRRLLSPSRRAQLARSLHELADQAPLRVARPHPGRPLYTPIVLTALTAELHATARRLEEQPVGLRGVALTELLLTAHDSPLYGTDPRRLREDLHGIAFALQSIETGWIVADTTRPRAADDALAARPSRQAGPRPAALRTSPQPLKSNRRAGRRDPSAWHSPTSREIADATSRRPAPGLMPPA